MTAYLVLVLAALSRLIPHALHGVGLNFTADGGGLLFFGARRSRWEAGAAAGLMALTDVYLTHFVYGYPFHLRGYLVTWVWYAAVCLLGQSLLRRITARRLVASVLASATSFFLLSNFVVWLSSGLYTHSVPGLAACYAAALPFYADDLVSTGITVAVLFALPVAAASLVSAWREIAAGQRPVG